MNRTSILLGAAAGLLLGTPVMGAITLTNGDFSAADAATAPGWQDGPFGGGMFTVAGGPGGVGLSSAGATESGLYQTFSDADMASVTISFDFNLITAGSGGTERHLDFRTLDGITTGNNFFRFRIHSDGLLDYVNSAGSFADVTNSGTPFVADIAGTYRFDLVFTGLDGAGGATGTVNGTITRASDSASYGFSATNANWVPIDSMEFMHGNNWGAGQQYSIDNVVVAPEPTVALLGGIGLLGLLRRRRI